LQCVKNGNVSTYIESIKKQLVNLGDEFSKNLFSFQNLLPNLLTAASLISRHQRVWNSQRWMLA